MSASGTDLRLALSVVVRHGFRTRVQAANLNPEIAIQVTGLTKTFRTYKKQPGLKGAIMGLINRQYEDVPAVKEGFAKQNPAKILEIVLCEDKGKYIYQLKVLEPAGRVRFHTLDAKKPF